MSSKLSTAELLAHVDSLELAEPKLPEGRTMRSLGVECADKTQAAYVAGGSIVAFTANVQRQPKQDILDATLLAQLNSNKLFDRETQIDKWYDNYVKVLGNIGFAMQSYNFSQYHSGGSSLKMDKAILEIMKAAATGSGMTTLIATLDSLEKMADNDGAITLFETNSSSNKMGNFQLVLCDQKEGDHEVNFTFGFFYFSADKQVTRFLWFSWSSSSINLNTGSTNVTLNEKIYSTVRAKITEKLEKKAGNFVHCIEL